MILRVLIFLVASAAAGGAAWLTTQPENAAARVEIRDAGIPTIDVLVASGDITSGEVLSPDKMRWEPWPEPNMNEGFITRAARPDAAHELSGTFVNSAFVTGEPIREARLMAVNENLLSTKIEPGKRAAAVKVTAESTAGGFILPGDRVDVIHTMTIPGADGRPPRNESRIIIANARVLAIDQVSSQTPEGSVLGETATLELTPVEAERIMAAEASGLLSLALRSVADHADSTPVLREIPVQRVLVHRGGESSTVTIR